MEKLNDFDISSLDKDDEDDKDERKVKIKVEGEKVIEFADLSKITEV